MHLCGAFIFNDYFRRRSCRDTAMIGMRFTGIVRAGGAAATMKTEASAAATATSAAT
jgi:hypothetical protein